MKQLLILILSCVSFGFNKNDNPYFERIAFDLYKSEIINTYPLKKKVRVYQYSFQFHPNIYYFDTPDCLEDVEWISNDQFQTLSNEINLDHLKMGLNVNDLDLKKFKLKKNGKGTYPKLFISKPHIEKSDDQRIFVNIYEHHSKLFTIIYHIEFDTAGNIIDWCREGIQTVVIG